jgi:hypothetical protein
MVLEDCESSCGLQLFVIECEEIRLSFFNFVKHVLPEFLCHLNLLSFLLIHFISPVFLFLVEVCRSSGQFRPEGGFYSHKVLYFIVLCLEIFQLLVKAVTLCFVGGNDFLDFLVVMANGLFDFFL